MSAVNSNTENIGIVLLAAGASMRLGRPKQLLPYHGGSLLQHMLQVAAASNAGPVVVVLGAKADAIQDKIKQRNVRVVVNAEWKEGMASSIRCGVKGFCELDSSAEGVILMVCDQPFVNSDLLNRLMSAHYRTRKPIIACGYENTVGPPVFFHKNLFPELLQLKGETGAKKIVRQHAGTVEVLPFPEGAYDVDTEADYEKIKRIAQP